MSEPLDLAHYAPAERQVVDGETRYVRLVEEPMHVQDTVPWLIEHGFVRMERDDHPESESGYTLKGWGSTYFAVPFDKAVPRDAL